jgi:hypothetical protein
MLFVICIHSTLVATSSIYINLSVMLWSENNGVGCSHVTRMCWCTAHMLVALWVCNSMSENKQPFQLTHIGKYASWKTAYMMGKWNSFDCQQGAMLCMTLRAAVKSDCGFLGNKHKTHINWKVHMMVELVQAGSDHVMALWSMLIWLYNKWVALHATLLSCN